MVLYVPTNQCNPPFILDIHFFGGHLTTDPSIATPRKIEICSQDVDISQVFYLFVGC